MTAAKNPPTIRETCGTLSGATAHSRADEAQCSDCRAARNAYQREYSKRPEARQKLAAYQLAYRQALRDLAKLHPGEFDALIAMHTGRRLP